MDNFGSSAALQPARSGNDLAQPAEGGADDHIPGLELPELSLPPLTEVEKSAFQAHAPRPLPLPAPELAEPLPEKSVPPIAAPDPAPPRFAGMLLPSAVFMAVVLLTLYLAPYLLVHWRTTEAQGEAEAIYIKRRAELKAEAEAADERLKVLDKRVHLTSLGFREVVRKVAPIVVHVSNYREPRPGEVVGNGKRPRFRDPDNDRKYVQAGVGSGIIVNSGFVLTNYHVVKDARRLRVTFASGRSVGEDPATVAADPLTDLAVIRLSGSKDAGLREDMNVAAEFADSDKDVHVGDWALAIGSPLGLRQTVTQGIISAKDRLLGMLDLVELIQTDAAINPGNSGGPLFDQHGRVAGINVAIASDNGGNQGIGFAIPSNTAKHIFNQLVAKGEVLRGYLGVALEELNSRQLKAIGLADKGAVYIFQVVPGEAASKAGLQVGDVIVRYRNELLDRVQPMRHLRQMILDTAPETQVALEIIRGNRHQTLNVQVGKRPAFVVR
jgi:serine protease Do